MRVLQKIWNEKILGLKIYTPDIFVTQRYLEETLRDLQALKESI